MNRMIEQIYSNFIAVNGNILLTFQSKHNKKHRNGIFADSDSASISTSRKIKLYFHPKHVFGLLRDEFHIPRESLFFSHHDVTRQMGFNASSELLKSSRIHEPRREALPCHSLTPEKNFSAKNMFAAMIELQGSNKFPVLYRSWLNERASKLQRWVSEFMPSSVHLRSNAIDWRWLM